MPKNKTFIVYVIALIYILVGTFFISKEEYTFFALFNTIPVVLIIIYFSLFSLDKLLFLIIFLTPISIPISEFVPNIENDIILPIEPLLFGTLLLFIVKLIFEKKSFDAKILKHPISIAIYFNLIWMFITSISSTMPIVSFKFLLARLWFLATFFFLASHLFKNKKNIYKYFWLFTISFLIVILYTLYKHSLFGLFSQKHANQAVSPFLPDHTSYAAIIAMLIPFSIGTLSMKKYTSLKKVLISFSLLILTTGIIFSYTRAAWLSLVGAFGVYIIILLKIRFRFILISSIIIISLFFTFKTQIFISLERNNKESTDNFTEHVESISNISTDASNLERINRWNSAIRMFKDKPVFGFGPATYMFQYAPYQLASEKTIISTNNGDVGNAHSEYLGPLAESGLLGILSIVLVFSLIIYYSLKVYNSTNDKEIKTLSLILLLGISSYLLHGFLNDFLDLPTASAIFWGYSAAIMSLDIYHKGQTTLV
ncbi:MAG: O-antigen ligase family protein [Chlorobi bacterium]|nr:O-antigen ligase family protein [Chlorobiota bacterium]